MSRRPTIFVQIASYRDPECQWTIRDLFEKAKHPRRVHVGVCGQYDSDLDQRCFEIASPNPDNTVIMNFPAKRSRGVCWARWQAQKLFDDQDYVLMIDSHMRFVEHWDSKMIRELARCESDKPFFSCYPASYRPPDNLNPDPKVTILKSKPYDKRGSLRMDGTAFGRKFDMPRPNAFLAAGYLFTKGSFIKEVPYDPHIYFNDEEICLAARAYTHGWDGFAPSRVYIFHHYHNKKIETQKSMHWKDDKKWRRYSRISRARREYLLCGTEPVDHPEAMVEMEKYGLGGARALADYETFCGIDFTKKEVSEMALKGAVRQTMCGHAAERQDR